MQTIGHDAIPTYTQGRVTSRFDMAYTRVLLTLPAVAEFFGRDAQLNALDEAAKGNPFILVTGEPGVGRSRLLAHWLKHQPKIKALHITAPRPAVVPGALCAELLLALSNESELAEDPVRKLTKLLVQIAARHDAQCGRDLAQGVPYLLRAAGFDPQDENERSLTKFGYLGELVAGLRGLVACLCRDAAREDHRLALVIDDLDKADAASGQLFGRAIASLEGDDAPLLAATCVNAADVTPRVRVFAREAAVIAVPPFTSEEQNTFISRILKGTTLPRRLNETLWRRSSGNALVIEQQIRLLVTQHIIISGADNTWTVAEGVESAGSTKATPQLIADNYRGLPGATLQAVVAAGAIGLRVPEPMLMAMIRELGGETEDLPRHSIRLVKQGFLEPLARAEGDWVFRHPVYRDACECVMPPADQKQLHRAALNALAPFAAAMPQRLVPLRMHHALACGAFEEALACCAAACRDALRRGLFLGVLELADGLLPHLSNIRDTEPNVANKAAVLLALTRAHIKLGNYGRAGEVIAMLPGRELLDASTLRAALCETADVYVVSGKHPEIVVELETALALTPRGTLDYAELAFSFGVLVRRRGETERAREMFSVAREVFVKHGQWGRALDCLHQAANVYRQENKLDQAELLLDEAFELTSASENRFDLAGTLLALGSVKAHRGKPVEGEQAFKKCYDLLTAIGDLGRAEMARLNLGSVYYWQGRIDEATQIYEAILSNARRRDEVAASLYCLLNLGLIALYQGRNEQAIARLSEARAECINAGTTAALAVIESGLARAYVAMKRFDDARDVVAAAFATAREHSQLDFEAMALCLQAEIDAHNGELAKAVEGFEAAIGKFEELTALGMVSEELARGDIALRYAAFLLDHGGALVERGLITFDPRDKVRVMLAHAELEYRQMIDSGNVVRKRELDETLALMKRAS